MNDGREMLGLLVGASRTTDGNAPRFDGVPRREGRVETDGRRVDARYERSGPWVRVVLAEAVAVGAEALLVDDRGVRHDVAMLAAIDGATPAQRRRLARLLAALDAQPVDEVVQAVRAVLERERPSHAGLSPAARRLLAEMMQADESDATVLHAVALLKQGREPMVRELVAAGLVLELEHGHLIPRDRYDRLLASRRPDSPADAADAWGCSRGRARAILRRMTHDGDPS